jgi:hypothetical protein
MNRINIFSEIHEIVFHGQGGYDWETIYNMPIWLRRYTFQKIKAYYDKQNESSDSTVAQDPNKTLRPAVTPKPTYTTKTTSAAKK